MDFNVVIGNPPYNRGGDIDFVDAGFELQTDYTVMITPAKWQTAEADQKIASKMSYGEFRKKIVPHMREIVFYPDCGDVFNIGVADGITYYLLEKGIQSECIIINKCKLQKYFNNTSNREIRADSVLNNLGTEIIEYLGKYDRFKFKKYSECRYQVWINTQINPGYGRWGHSKSGYGGELSDGGGNGGFFLSLSGNANIVGKIQIIDTENGEKISSGTAILGMQSDKLSECESFKSYINCKFTRFFVLINISKVTVANDNTFRFVPIPMVLDEQGNRVPGKFDHIYTDEELYKTWNLPQKYVDVIEAVIKERK